jgi:hypothetical protein
MIRRVTGVMTLTLVSLVVTAGAAMAQTSTYPPPVSVKGASGTDGGGATAFTGSSQISVGTLMVVALVIAGLAALFVARRRAARFAG